MITLFATPKPFKGPSAVIQRNAITSWTLLCPRPEIILFGTEEGTGELCDDLGLRHVPDVERNASGIPLVRGMFFRAQELAAGGLMGYVNADIILLSDFMKAVQAVQFFGKPFLMTGRRRNLDMDSPVSFETGWEERLRADAVRRGRLIRPEGMDYFVFRRNRLPEIPGLAVGRPWWDGVMAYQARACGFALVDATLAILAVHQNHSYGPGGWDRIFDGEDARANLRTGGGLRHIYTVHDATHCLVYSKNSVPSLVRTGFFRSCLYFLTGVWKRRVWYPAVMKTRPARHRLGLTKENFLKGKAFFGL